jgi:hypothetical protein
MTAGPERRASAELAGGRICRSASNAESLNEGPWQSRRRIFGVNSNRGGRACENYHAPAPFPGTQAETGGKNKICRPAGRRDVNR